MRVQAKRMMKEGMRLTDLQVRREPYLRGTVKLSNGNATFSPNGDQDGLPGLHNVQVTDIDGNALILEGIEITGGGKHYAQSWLLTLDFDTPATS